MPDLLARWESELDSEERALLPGPASELQLAAVEARLGATLPPGFRSFLAHSDGWPLLLTTGRSGLRGTADLGWFRDVERDWYEVWRDIDADNPEVALMARALIISTPGDEALLLDPEDVDESGEWSCSTFSNWAAGSNRIGSSYRAGLERRYTYFLQHDGAASASTAEINDQVERAYRALLAGDVTARTLLDGPRWLSWRAVALAAQFDAFDVSASHVDTSTTFMHLLWEGKAQPSAAAEHENRLVTEELLQLWVVRLIEANLSIEHELRRALAPVAEQMQNYLDQIHRGTGLIADFSYAPARFADGIASARDHLSRDEPDAAWNAVLAALPHWRPMSPAHLLPNGLYYDKDLRRLLFPPTPERPQAPPGHYAVVRSRPIGSEAPPTSASVTPLPNRTLRSPRTLAILETKRSQS